MVDPCEIARAVEIAERSCWILRRDSVHRPEVDHPLSAQLDRFIGRDTKRSRRRTLTFHSTSLPDATVTGLTQRPLRPILGACRQRSEAASLSDSQVLSLHQPDDPTSQAFTGPDIPKR